LFKEGEYDIYGAVAVAVQVVQRVAGIAAPVAVVLVDVRCERVAGANYAARTKGE
jgi:hypothetical protein